MPIPQRSEIKAQLINLLRTEGTMRTDRVYAFFASAWQLSPDEFSAERSGRELFKNEIRWARQELVIEGVIAKPEVSGKGIWSLINRVFVAPEHYEQDISEVIEGAKKRVLVNSYERNRVARQKCLESHGYSCTVCDFNFEKTYGAVGIQCIHVHHLTEISTVGKEYRLNPVKDLVPVCPNCHYIIHRRKPAFTIDEVKAMLNASSIER